MNSLADPTVGFVIVLSWASRACSAAPRTSGRQAAGAGQARQRPHTSGQQRKSATINAVSVAQALVVAKHLNFRAAARALGIRQSAVSPTCVRWKTNSAFRCPSDITPA